MLKINCINTISPVVSALVSRSIAPGTSPGLADHRDIVLCSCRARHFTLTVPLSTQVCKRVLSNLKKSDFAGIFGANFAGKRSVRYWMAIEM